MPDLKSLRKKRVSALIITAHPDDESLFAGGAIAEFRKWRWRVLCVTDCDKGRNMRRRKELLRVCRIYGRHGITMAPFMLGAAKKKGRFSAAEISRKIGNFLRTNAPPDIVFTHGKDGEYGHKTHKLIHGIVKKAWRGTLYCFSPCHGGRLRHNEAESIRLSERSLSLKKLAINVYLNGSQKTNLSRLKRVVNNALTGSETFYKLDKGIA